MRTSASIPFTYSSSNPRKRLHPSRLGRMAFLLALSTSSTSVQALRLSRAASRGALSTCSLWTSQLDSRGSDNTSTRVDLSGLLSKGISSRQFSSKTYTERPLSTSSAATRASAADTDDDIDAALDSILDDVMVEAGRAANGHNEIPDILIEEEPDFANTKSLSITNQYWVENGLDPLIIDVLSSKGISSFTTVQAEAFKPVLAGRDVIGRSRTGTGKTLAFGVPACLRIRDVLQQNDKFRKRGRLPSMLVLCPTRELARQVQEEIEQVCKPLGLFSSVFHGGVSYDPQAKDLRQGVDIVVGTPGRIIDHIERGNLKLSECNVAVLDEADEMLNMGFAEDVERILDGVGSANAEKTQCLLFSATTPPWVKDIGRQYQRDVLSIDVTASQGSGVRTATTVRHVAVQVPPGTDARKAILEDIIAVNICKDDEAEGNGEESDNPIAEAAREKKRKGTHLQQKIFGKTIVFTETKKDADDLVSGGVFKSLTAQALHGDVSQKQRDATLGAFRQGAFNVLVATDVAARGIDVQDVDLVIQFSPPRDPDSYVHRSGRTGRAGKKGVSICLFTPGQARDIANIERSIGHGFKFELSGPPSTESALHAIAKTSAVASKSIPDETSKYFTDAAESLLAEEDADPVDIVAKCLAAISRRSADVVSRSLLTGEVGCATVEMSNVKGRRVSPGDVMFTVSKLAQMSRRDGDLAFESEVGKIQSNAESSKAFFDMSVEDAKRLIEFSKGVDAGGARFTILREMEVERGRNFGEGRDRFAGRGGSKYGSDERSAGRDGGRKVFRGGGYHRSGDAYHSGAQQYGRGGRTGGRRDNGETGGRRDSYENRGQSRRSRDDGW